MGSGMSKKHQSFAVTPSTPPRSEEGGLAYSSGRALDAALSARFKAAAADGADPSALRRQFAYHRLLSRLFAAGDRPDAAGGWVLKGGTALLSRIRWARHTLDIDLLHNSAADLEDAVAELRDAAASDVGDFFRFDVGPATPIAAGADTPVDGRRVSVTAFCGRGVPFAQFRIDLVITDHMTGPPDTLIPTPVVEVAGLPQPAYRVSRSPTTSPTR
jgi:Nucleotidyl transferase AbiEii toxin, Type IV TA system